MPPGSDAPVAVPVASGEGAGAPAPELSVIVTLVDHREFALAAVRSWVEGQTHPRGAFEVVAVSDGREPALERSATALLAPHDQLVVMPGAEQMDLLHAGAERARGAVLLFTEGHAEAGPEAVATALAHLAAGGADAVTLRSTSDDGAPLTRMEKRQFAVQAKSRLAPGAWNRIFLRGFAIRRAAYFAAGGFERSFDLFAEPALAMALHRAGCRIAISDSTVIFHHNTTTLWDLYLATARFARGQCLYRAERPAEYARYLGPLVEWAHRGGIHAGLSRAAWRDCLRVCRAAGNTRTRALATRALLRFAPAAALGRRAAVIGEALRLVVAVLRSWLWRWNDARLAPAYADVHQRMANYARLRWVAALRVAPPLQPIGIGRAVDMLDENGLGLHPPEATDAGNLRWTEPAALIALDLAPGRYRVTLEKRGLRADLAAADLAAALDGRALPPGALTVTADAVVLDIAVAAGAPSPQRLLLLCAPLRKPAGSGDPRALGLPLFAVSIAPATGNAAAAPPAAAREPVAVG
jgi:hypothetical protein